MINVIFIFIYALFGSIISAQILLVIFSFHCFLILIPFFRQKKIIATPVSLYIIGVVIVNIANYILIGNIGTPRNTSYGYIVPRYVNIATQIWCISSTSIIVGYEFVKNRSFPSIELIVKKKSSLEVIFFLLIIIDILQMYGINLFNTAQLFKLISLVNLIGILFFSRLSAKSNSNKYLYYAIALLVLQTYQALMTAYLRLNLIMPVIILFLGYFIGKEDMKYLFSFRIVPFLVAFALFASVFSTLGTTRSNFYYVFANYGDIMSSNRSKQNDENNTALLNRSANLAQITCIVDLVNRNGLYNGAASAPLVLALVPRFLWHDKPNIALGSWFALETGIAYKNEFGNINNSINMTIGGELFLDFGWIGVIVGCVLFGAFFSLMWNSTKFYSSELNLTGILFGGYLLFIALINFAADLQIVITIFSYYFSFWVIKRFVKNI